MNKVEGTECRPVITLVENKIADIGLCSLRLDSKKFKIDLFEDCLCINFWK